ncbi:hypothetical protein [Desulfoscipio geothermicus]|uniref:hypothetical protein n=1 Tax=Desulfoscipio geothermicus TaxID=39060 RepID=UPI0013F4D6A3|nr:hypothetical protein [Desulfoscipio geothermicus]
MPLSRHQQKDEKVCWGAGGSPQEMYESAGNSTRRSTGQNRTSGRDARESPN